MGGGVAKLYFRSIESVDEIESGLDEIHAEVEVLFGSSSSLPSFSRRELTFTRNQGSGSGDYSCDLSSLSSGYSMFLYGPWCGGSGYDGIGYQTRGSSFFWETTGGHFKDLYTDEKHSDVVVNGGFFCSDGENTKLKITDDNGAVLYKKSFGGPVVHLKAGWNVGGYTTAVDQDIEFKGPFVGGGPAEYYYVPVDYAGSTGDEDFLTNAWEDGPFLLWKLNGGRIEFTYGQYGAKEITIFDPTNLNNEEVLPLTSSNVPTGQFSITRSISESPAILATTDQLLQIGTTSTTAAAGDHTHNTLVSQDSKVTVTATNDGTLTINKPGVSLTDNDTLASLATILGLPDTASLSDVQQALGLPDTATLADAMQAAAAPVNTRFATIDELPEVPIKAVKQNGTALTPDSNGAVNIEVPEAPVKAIKQNGASLTPDSNGAVNVGGVYYATCSTAQDTAAKVATLKNANETFVLEEGVVVYVKFTNLPAAVTQTLNVAGTGAKTIQYGTYAAPLYNYSCAAWRAGEIVGFIYDGTYWRMLRPAIAGTSTDGVVRIADYLSSDLTMVPGTKLLYNVGTSIAPRWVKNTTYSAGDYVMYEFNGKLYKAKVDIPANTSWNANNWEEVKVMAEMAAGAGAGSYSLTTPEQATSTTTTTNDTITVQLSDKAINAVQVPTTVTNVVMKFPQQETGKARDFLVRLIVTGETVPSITLTEQDGSAVEFDVDDDSWTEIEQGVNLLMFTETAQ